MKSMLLFLLLCAVPVHATTFYWDATKTRQMALAPCDNGVVASNGGITAMFGPLFSYNQINPMQHYECDVYYPSGLFRPESHGDWTISMDWSCPDDLPGSPNYIQFSPPIRYFAVDIMGSTTSHQWDCPPWISSVDGGLTWNTHVSGGTLGTTGSLTPQSMVEMWTDHPGAGVQPAMIDAWAGCGTDPPAQPSPSGTFDWSNNLRPYCNWQRVEVISPVLASRIYFRFFNAEWHTPLYLDNFSASTMECPQPPCDFERAGLAREESPLSLVESHPNVVGPKPLTARAVHPTPAQRTSWGSIKRTYYR
jgi:hypothetical protein